ncbi:flagellar brake protein [Pseudomonas schmalbachii]|nr:flagellar regulator YcgR PilZN domain-containing protein [Pseudomonas schmalbachii]
MSSPFAKENGPQPPRTLKAPMEIHACLRMLLDAHTPLVISFAERNQRFQSYVVEIDRENDSIALDELMPNDGERYLNNAEPFHIEASHDGIRIVWECRQAVEFGELEKHRCYWLPAPTEMLYHQRRNAYRAKLKQTEPVSIEIAGEKLKAPLSGKMLDISATGCKVRFSGDVGSRLHPGEVYERFTARMPGGTLVMEVEVRHVKYDEKLNTTFAGLRFHRINGLEQRQVERFVYQLQREARRFEKEELF